MREEIDNPRMRGRKLIQERRPLFLFVEEIDNPRMRGRKHNELAVVLPVQVKKLIIPG